MKLLGGECKMVASRTFEEMERDRVRLDSHMMKKIIYELMTLIEKFVDDGSCEYDHNDLCQSHSLDARPCPHEVAKDICERGSGMLVGRHGN